MAEGKYTHAAKLDISFITLHLKDEDENDRQSTLSLDRNMFEVNMEQGKNKTCVNYAKIYQMCLRVSRWVADRARQRG